MGESEGSHFISLISFIFSSDELYDVVCHGFFQIASLCFVARYRGFFKVAVSTALVPTEAVAEYNK